MCSASIRAAKPGSRAMNSTIGPDGPVAVTVRWNRRADQVTSAPMTRAEPRYSAFMPQRHR
jgi:hypothetical protein